MMKLEWMGKYRELIGHFYRSANGYSQICKTEMFGDPVPFSPYEVQILEHIMEYAEERKNMKWYASRLGLSQATFSKYIQKLVDKGLVEKYHVKGNRKDIILMLTPMAQQEYAQYSVYARENLFREFFNVLDEITPEELDAVNRVFAALGQMHHEKSATCSEEQPLIRVGENA